MTRWGGEQSGKLLHVYSGHSEDVTALALMDATTVVSVSIDGTIRRWELGEKAFEAARAEEERRRAGEEVEVEVKGGVTTTEEDAELAALMDEED